MMTEQVTHATISHVSPSCRQQTDMEKPILPKPWQDLGKITPSPRKFGKIDQCGTSQFNIFIGGTYTPSPTFHTPTPSCQKREIE